MQFKNPELLYALLLLIVPILIHLFQLRRFQKVQFTNVKLLKQINLQTRKSSELKKWLVLMTRLFIIGCVVLAFAQPYIPNTDDYNVNQETVIYLDNSFSMQAKGVNGSLLNGAIQNLISSVPENEKISIFTNEKVYRNTTLKAIKNDLIELEFSSFQLPYQAVYIKGKELFSNDNSAKKNLVLVSDFQQKNEFLNLGKDSIVNLKLVKQQPKTTTNISVDSVYIKNRNAETLDISVILSSFGNIDDDISVSLYNNDELLAKNTASFSPDNNTEVVFTIQNNTAVNGKIVIEDIGLSYDNDFYFNLNAKPKIKVISISENGVDTFLNRIYTSDEFEYLSSSIKTLNFNLIPQQDLVVLNELKGISDALVSACLAFVKDGGSLIVIPSSDGPLEDYNKLLKELAISPFAGLNTNTKRITRIDFDHPLLRNTFYSKVSNFQYPKTEQNFTIVSKNNSVLDFEDGTPFLTGYGNVFAFTAPLNRDNSNFINSQLIVPVFYNIGLQSLPLAQLYYTLGSKNAIAIKTVLGPDEILTLDNANTSVIPLQKTYSNSVVIETEDFPRKSGILTVKSKENSIQNLSFNYSREESQFSYFDLENILDSSIHSSLVEAIESIKSNTNVNALWKWFVIFALIFLLTEMFLLKYLK